MKHIRLKAVYKPYAEGIVKMLSCIAPHICEEMWEKLGHEGTIAYEAWPTYEEDKLVVSTIEIAVQVNGKKYVDVYLLIRIRKLNLLNSRH